MISAFLLLSGITGNKQADSLRRGSFPPCQGDIYVVKGQKNRERGREGEERGQGSDPSVED